MDEQEYERRVHEATSQRLCRSLLSAWQEAGHRCRQRPGLRGRLQARRELRSRRRCSYGHLRPARSETRRDPVWWLTAASRPHGRPPTGLRARTHGANGIGRRIQGVGLCNAIAEDGESVVGRALDYARLIAANSPDATIVTREGLKMGWEVLGVADASRLFLEGWSRRIYEGTNIQEGLDAFVEKQEPRWRDSKL